MVQLESHVSYQPSSALLWFVWPFFGAQPSRKGGLFLFPPLPYPSAPFFSYGRWAQVGGARGVEEWEAWSGLPSSGHFHQPGTPTIPRDLIFIFIGSHSVWNVSGFLVMANLGWKEMAEITDSNF